MALISIRSNLIGELVFCMACTCVPCVRTRQLIRTGKVLGCVVGLCEGLGGVGWSIGDSR